MQALKGLPLGRRNQETPGGMRHCKAPGVAAARCALLRAAACEPRQRGKTDMK